MARSPSEVALIVPLCVFKNASISSSRVLMIEPYRCAMSHPSSVLHRDFRTERAPCDKAHMAKFDMEAFRARLTELMEANKIKRKPLAKAAGLGETSIRDIFESKRNNVSAGTLVQLADYFRVSLDELISAPELRLAGRIGAGGEVVFEPDEDPEAPSVPRPPGAAGNIMALRVVGISMLPKYEDGDIVYVRKDVDGIRPSYIGEYCAVRTKDGGTWLKILSKGSQAGRYTLRSLNAEDMENVEVEWASPVRWVMPRSARAA